MSKYTTQIRFICETSAGLKESSGYNDVEKILTDSIDKIFDFDYPIFDEMYRGVLERKILRHYYTREIAFETVGLWKLKLSTRLNEIMPYYNKLYETETFKFNPLYDTDYWKTGNRAGNGQNKTVENGNNTQTTTGKTDSNSTSWKLFNDTPQGGLSGVDSMHYLSSAEKNTDENKINNAQNINSSNNRNNTQDIKSTEEYSEHISGKFGGKSYAVMLKEYRQNLLNIDMNIINDLNDLFIMLW